MRKRTSYGEVSDDAAYESSRPARSWLGRICGRPKDVLSLGLVAAGAGVIVINALFLQAGPHPAPIFTDAAVSVVPAPLSTTAAARPKSPEPRRPTADLSVGTTGTANKPAAAGKSNVATPPAASARPDPIAELLEPSNRVISIQRTLTQFGYGQIKPTGNIGPETKAAIEKFERERNLPVSGQISDRLTRELIAVKGGPL